jgi:hypothetical protein
MYGLEKSGSPKSWKARKKRSVPENVEKKGKAAHLAKVSLEVFELTADGAE